MTSFTKILEENWIRAKFSKLFDHYIYQKNFDIESMIKKDISNKFLNDISSKIEIQKTERAYTTEYESEMFIFNRKNLFLLLHAFNRLNLDDRTSVIKHISPSDEIYRDVVRYDTINTIFDEENYKL